LEKIELTRKEWEDYKAYVEFKGRKKKPCVSCPMCHACLGVEPTKNKCKELKDWIKERDELYSKVSRFIANPELEALTVVMLDRMQREESIRNLKVRIAKEENKRFKLLQSENTLFNERITFKE
jgi:hypothetical protein